MISYRDSIIGMDQLLEIDNTFSWDKVTYIDAIQYYILKDDFYNDYSVVELVLRYSVNSIDYKITVKFSSVINLSLNRIGGEYNQILGFEIIDKSNDGWDKNQRFLVNDYEDGIISFICKDIEILSVDGLNNE